MKVLACDGIDPAAVKRIRDAGHEVVEAKGLAAPDLLTALRGVQGLLVRSATKVTAEVLAGAPDLKVVVRAGTGLDNVDRAAAESRGVIVRNTPNANSVSVAEITFAMLLALERHIADAAADLRAGRWEKSKYQGRELHGRTLGVIGFGRIGQEVASRARAFGMAVIAYDPAVSAGPAGYEWVRHTGRDALLAEADVVTLHVPLTDDTRHSLSTREFELMKRDAVLVNASRGGVVDEVALHAALAGGRPRAAAIDVFEKEPAPAGHPLLGLPNVLPLPHLGASTGEAQRRAGMDAAEALLEVLAALPAR
ncbi:MAG TPA: hydroxyacid dehydrogenase [Candidatus Eisenbacteria bacterium]|jgi:D-3-phosphoglycerate dehydrogenase